MPLTIHDVLLPKHVTDSCYASITQIYRDMFELTPKSNLKISNSRSSLKPQSSNMRHSSSANSLEKNTGDKYPVNRTSGSRFLSFGSLKKTSSAQINYASDRDIRRSERKFQQQGQFNKSDKMRASWHEGDTKRNVVGTKIEFVTKF